METEFSIWTLIALNLPSKVQHNQNGQPCSISIQGQKRLVTHHGNNQGDIKTKVYLKVCLKHNHVQTGNLFKFKINK